jgi:ABC-type Fe3+ transport system permease subunit
MPGMLAALLLVLVRTIAMFELTFLTAGPTSQTLVVALYYAVFAAGVRAVQSIDAMAVIYMVTTLIWLIALRFVNPTQIVARAKQENRAMTGRRWRWVSSISGSAPSTARIRRCLPMTFWHVIPRGGFVAYRCAALTPAMRWRHRTGSIR